MHTVPHLGPAWHGRSCHPGRTLWGPRACKRQPRFLHLLGEMWPHPRHPRSPLLPFLPALAIRAPTGLIPSRSLNTGCSLCLYAFGVTPLGPSDWWLLVSLKALLPLPHYPHPDPKTAFVSSPLCCCSRLSILVRALTHTYSSRVPYPSTEYELREFRDRACPVLSTWHVVSIF